MQTWDITISALQPLTISSNPGRDNHWETADYIPATTLRGAIAELWKYEIGFNNPYTKDLFQNAIWHDAYSINTQFSTLEHFVCKLCGQKNNILIDYVSLKVKDSDKQLKLKCSNPKCKGSLIINESYHNSEVVIDHSVGIEVSLHRESTIHGRLYTRSQISKGTTFKTTAHLNEEAIKIIGDKNNDGTYSMETYIGKKSSSGYGKVHILFKKINQSKEDYLINLKDKIDTYSKIYDNDVNSNWYINITTKSPIILLDKYFRPTNKIDWLTHIAREEEEVDLIKKLSNEEGRMDELATWGLASLRHGWNAAWNLPKKTDWVINPGSVNLYRFSNLNSEEKEILLNMLYKIEMFGIGERTNEGFGELEVCNISDKNTNQESISINNIKTDDHIEAKLLDEAEAFFNICNQYLHKSQLYNLKQYKETEIVNEIIEDDKNRYIYKRLVKGVKDNWQKEVEWNEENLSLGVVLRKIVEGWQKELGFKLAGRHTKQFLDYVLGYYQIYKKEKDGE